MRHPAFGEVSTRVANALESLGIHDKEALAQLDELQLVKLKNVGMKTVEEVRELAQRMQVEIARRLGESPHLQFCQHCIAQEVERLQQLSRRISKGARCVRHVRAIRPRARIGG